MQKASKRYKQSIKAPLRNRGYIKAYLGVINLRAQHSIEVSKKRTNLAYVSNVNDVFNGYEVRNLYATAENDFSHVDGSMFFAPQSEDATLYNNGIVSNSLNGSFYFVFRDEVDLDIKGLTIDFGECYPTKFVVSNDNTTKEYTNDKRIFSTEDVFNATSFFTITATEMVNGKGRLRIHQFTCGIANTFTNNDVKSYSWKEYVSSVCDSIPSQDMTLTVDNQNRYYNVDNPDSVIAYMEQGQEIRVSFGYDVGDGKIEWIKENVAYIKSWSSTDTEAKFTAVDIFEFKLSEKYYKGLYRKEGISLYDLAIDVLNDAGITDDRQIYIDDYLRKVIVYNPMPVVSHKEALQIIANMGRCTLSIDRDSKIHIQSSFVPDSVATSNNATEFSNMELLLKNTVKSVYADASKDYTLLNGEMKFLPTDGAYLTDIGYVSDSIFFRRDSSRLPFTLGGEKTFQVSPSGFWTNETPQITIEFETAWVAYGLLIKFVSQPVVRFTIQTYRNDREVDLFVVSNNSELDCRVYNEWDLFDKMVITFDEGTDESRVHIDSILVGDITDYVLTRTYDLQGAVKGNRLSRIKSLNVNKTIWSESSEEIKELKNEEILLPQGTSLYTVYFNNPSYSLLPSIVVDEESDIQLSDINVEIVESSNYYAVLQFTNVPNDDCAVKYSIQGYEYVQRIQPFIKNVHADGETIEWTNPLCSVNEQAQDLEEWLEQYYLGDVEYQYNWRGDPRVDANDLFYLELKDQDSALVRCYENQLKFNGAWSGSMKARKVVMQWQ